MYVVSHLDDEKELTINFIQLMINSIKVLVWKMRIPVLFEVMRQVSL